MNILNVKNLTKKYNDTTAVDNISFQIEKGEIFGNLSGFVSRRKCIVFCVHMQIERCRAEEAG